MCIYRYPATVCDGVCLDVLSCLLGIFFFYWNGAVKIESAFVCRKKPPTFELFSLTCVVCLWLSSDTITW